jgi:branched-chain amino acid transport system ATP-binding protein
MLLEFKELHAGYGAVRALRGLSFQVPEGATVALLGANGAGKTTALKVISGLVRPSRGEVLFQGEPLTALTSSAIVRRGIVHVPEGRRIFPDLTVLENLKAGAYSRSDRAGIEADLDDVYRLFPILKERGRQLGGSLSGGEQQMLAIGRGLMSRPRLLLLDEPSLGLAPRIVADIFAMLRRINEERKITMLVVEQNANLALRNARMGYVLQLGRVVVSGPAEELRESREVIESYMGAQHA